MSDAATTTAPKTPAPRRWLRRSAIALASLALLLGAAFWLLGREATLQTLVQKIADASGGQIVVSGVSGSLYDKMHLDHASYRSPDSNITAENITINWSPLQYFSHGIAINQLHVAKLVFESVGPSKPAVLPETLAPPFQLGIADARVTRLTLVSAGSNHIIDNLRFKLAGDQTRWRLQDASAATPWGLAAVDATIGATSPFALDGKASLTQVSMPAGQKPAQLLTRLHGNLSLFDVNASGQSQQASGDALLTLAPFDPMILRTVNINGRGIDPALFNPAWPQADLRIELSAKIGTDQSVSGQLALSNQGTPGALDQQRLPLRAVSGQLKGTLTATTIESVVLDLAQAGKFTGGGAISRSAAGATTGSAAFKLHTDGIDLKAIHSKMNPTRIAGDIDLTSNGNTLALNAALVQKGLRLELQATLADALLQVQRARLLAGKGSISLSGQASLTGQQAFKANASTSHFNPAAFGAYPAADLNAEIRLNGHLAPKWQVAGDFALRSSRLFDQPLSGAGKLTFDALHVAGADIDLRLGSNSVQARGSFGAPSERLNLSIDAPKLASLGPQFGGVLRGSGVLSGTSAAPALSFTLDGNNLRLLDVHQIKTLRASANLGSGVGAGAAGPSSLISDIELSGYTSPTLTLAGARLQTAGTRAAHTLVLSARNDDFDAAASVRGGWNTGAWNGTLDTLQNRGRYAFALQAPVPVRIAGPANGGVMGLLRPEQIALTNAVFTLPGGSISVQNLEKTGSRWRSTGQAAGLPLTYLAQLSKAWRDNVSSDLTLGAAWSLNLQAAAGADPAIDGMLHVFREKGDLTVGAEVPLTLGLSRLDARLDVANNALHLKVDLDGARAGNAHLDASVQMVHGRVTQDSALRFTGSADMASLAWLAPLSGQPGLDVGGAIKLAMTGSGSIGAPLLNGDITGEKLLLNWSDQGVKLRNGQLQARLAGDQLLLQRLSFDGVEGSALADGWLRFAHTETTMQLKVSADKLLVLARPDRTLVVSGQSSLTRDQKHFQLNGKFKAERAAIELAAQDTPTQSDDVVVLGQPRAVAKAPSLPLNIDIEADLGAAFYLKGKGVDAQLAGNVRILAIDRRPPRATGSIRVVSGTYAAYGQKLAIERGLITFTGAYDNPGLNILAVRKRPEDEALTETNVEAGVEVRGTALAPVAKLVSTPSVPDSEKLAWLVLGHGSAGTAGNELGLLTTAASALFGGSSGGSLQARLANSLGVDELGLAQGQGQAKGVENTVVTVGKRLSQRAYLSFEQGASTATSLVKLRYKLNPRITLQFQTGANTALDVLYTWAFD